MMTMSFGDEAPCIYLHKERRKSAFICFNNPENTASKSRRDYMVKTLLSTLKPQTAEKAYVLRRVNKLCYEPRRWLQLLLLH